MIILFVLLWMFLSLGIITDTILGVATSQAIRIEYLVLHTFRLLTFVLLNYLVGVTTNGHLQFVLHGSLMTILVSDLIWLGYLIWKVREWPFGLDKIQVGIGYIMLIVILTSFVSLNLLAPQFIGLATWLYLSALIWVGISLGSLLKSTPLNVIFSPWLTGLTSALSILCFGGIFGLGIHSLYLGETAASYPLFWSLIQLGGLALVYFVIIRHTLIQIKIAEEAIIYTQQQAQLYNK